MLPYALAPAWRERAEILRKHGAEQAAKTVETLADELEASLRAADNVPLTLAQAAAESGYSEDHLARQIRERKIPNAGQRGAPRIRVADLPRKSRVAAITARAYDPTADARSLLAGRLQPIGGAHDE
jgi:multidrug efflux pump subunit AcrA (membrane-fusion protein)